MKKLTPRRRRKIYLEAAEMINDRCHFLCWAFGTLIYNDDFAFLENDDNLLECQKLLPEFALFEQAEENSKNVRYWYSSEEEPRILGALFMAEMAKDAIK